MKILTHRAWLFILSVSTIVLSSCYQESKRELSDQDNELTEQIEDLENKIYDIEQDFYIAFEALTQLDSLLSNGNVDSSQIIIKKTLYDLGNIRFYTKDDIAIDMMTSQFIFTDTSYMNIRRELRYEEYRESLDSMKKTNDRIK
ncbi:MAG: hypothetical protein K2K68_02520 [Duncaniella sp.]|nr:hypothetical protein [Duncaniella sp.]